MSNLLMQNFLNAPTNTKRLSVEDVMFLAQKREQMLNTQSNVIKNSSDGSAQYCIPLKKFIKDESKHSVLYDTEEIIKNSSGAIGTFMSSAPALSALTAFDPNVIEDQFSSAFGEEVNPESNTRTAADIGSYCTQGMPFMLGQTSVSRISNEVFGEDVLKKINPHSTRGLDNLPTTEVSYNLNEIPTHFYGSQMELSRIFVEAQRNVGMIDVVSRKIQAHTKNIIESQAKRIIFGNTYEGMEGLDNNTGFAENPSGGLLIGGGVTPGTATIAQFKAWIAALATVLAKNPVETGSVKAMGGTFELVFAMSTTEYGLLASPYMNSTDIQLLEFRTKLDALLFSVRKLVTNIKFIVSDKLGAPLNGGDEIMYIYDKRNVLCSESPMLVYGHEGTNFTNGYGSNGLASVQQYVLGFSNIYTLYPNKAIRLRM